MPKKMSYATLLREAMSRRKPDGQVTTRDLEQNVVSPHGQRWVYEHFRKILSGKPVISRELNAALCTYLKLDADIMWRIAEQEKALRSIDRMKVLPQIVPNDERLQKAWRKLDEQDRKRALLFMEQLAGTRLDISTSKIGTARGHVRHKMDR
jgi:hypothetical protein